MASRVKGTRSLLLHSSFMDRMHLSITAMLPRLPRQFPLRLGAVEQVRWIT